MKRNIFHKDLIARSGDTCFLFGEQGFLTTSNLRILKKFLLQNPDWFFNLLGKEFDFHLPEEGKELEDFLEGHIKKGTSFSDLPSILPDVHIAYQKLKNYYRDQKHEEQYQYIEQDYSWLKELPRRISYQIQMERELQDTDAFSIVPQLPYAGFGYVIEEGGMVDKFYSAFKMHRLFYVHQLGFMHDSVHRVHDRATIAMNFNHTRGLHQLDVYAGMILIIENNPPLWPYRNVLLAAACSHDGRTPAGGDTTKLIDLELFDEEKNYKDFFKFPGWKALKDEYSLDEDQLYSVVKGEGLLGTVLDIADKIAYTARDVFMFMGMDGDCNEGRSDLFLEGKRLLKKDPYICNLWKHVRIKDGKVVIDNGKKLIAFAKLRTIMFKELYYKRESRFLEYVLSRKVENYLFKNNYITFAELLEENDTWLEEKIFDVLGHRPFPASFANSKIKIFKTREAAVCCYNKFQDNDDFIPIMDDFKIVSNSAVKKFNVFKNGKIIPFREVYPTETKEIEGIMTFPQEYCVSAISLGDLRVSKKDYDVVKRIKREVG